eukprot:1146041-Pelagomonas_calceolata.AAC.10
MNGAAPRLGNPPSSPVINVDPATVTCTDTASARMHAGVPGAAELLLMDGCVVSLPGSMVRKVAGKYSWPALLDRRGWHLKPPARIRAHVFTRMCT